jgi:cysteine-rich repeat protein
VWVCLRCLRRGKITVVFLRGALFATCLLAACTSSGTFVCSDGTRCSNGMQCAPNHGICIEKDRATVCAGKTDGAECSYLGTDGVCDLQVCFASSCGDGYRAYDEVCDDGNNTDEDGCSADCSSSEVCGNGILSTPTALP